ncbi:MAG: hypothetical protein HYW57_08030 [Ignavibacteriales bacterium]|nr:hypothetical protein [Ignavibacteriales bacterium]
MRSLFHILMLSAVILASLSAGERSNIRGLGMARTVNAASRGLHALGVNPANLGMGGERALSLDLFPFGFRMSSELISYDTYKDFFTGVPGPDGTRQPKFLTKEDKEKILNSFPQGIAVSQLDFEMTLMGLGFYHPSVGGIGVSVVERIGTRVVVPKDYVAIFLYGLDSLGSRYVFDETNLSAWWWREYNLSYGMKLPVHLQDDIEFYAGIGLKYISGYGALETTRYRATIANERESGNQYRAKLFFDYLIKRSGVDILDPAREAAFSFFPEPAGSGFGVDLGFAARLRGLDVHVSITDIGSVTWKRNIVETFGTYDLDLTDPFEGANEDTIQTAIRGKNRRGSEFSTNLPTKVRIGVALGADTASRPSWMPSDLILTADMTQGFNESMGNSGDLRFSLGTEYRGIPGVPIRTGFSIGDDSRFRWAFGMALDLRHFSFDFATENLGLLFSLRNFDLYSFAMGFRFRF